MSLEKALEENTAALKAQTAAITAQTDFLKSMKAGGAATTSGGGAATGKTTTAKEPKAPTADDLRNAASAFLGVEDASVAESRKADMKKVLAKMGLAKVTAATGDQIPQLIEIIATLGKGEVPEILADDDMV